MAKSTYTRTFLQELKIWTARIIPVSILVLGSSLVWNLSIGNKIANLEDKKITPQLDQYIDQRIDNGIKKKLEEESKEKSKNSLSDALERKDALDKINQSSPLGRDYINGEISKQAEEQSRKAAKDELSQARSDLIVQIAFPVVFAIASIFAAFAVKDILTEILKEEEKGRVISNIKSDVKESLEKLIGMAREDSSKSLIQELEHRLQEYARKEISSKTKDPIDRLDKGLQSIEIINMKVKEIEYEAADLTALQIVGSLSNPVVLNTYLRPISIIQELIECNYKDEMMLEVLNLCRDYQLKKLQEKIARDLPLGKMRSELEKVISYGERKQPKDSLQEQAFIEGLKNAMDNILAVRLAQFHELLTNLKKKETDKSKKREIQEKITTILDIDTPVVRLLRRINLSVDDDTFNETNIAADSSTPLKSVPRPIPETSPS